MPHRRPPTSPRRAAPLAALGLVAAIAAGEPPRPAHPAPPPRPAPVVPVQPARTGAQVYAAICAACHQPSGEGNGESYPPLAGSSWVTGDESRIVRIVLHGLTGEIDVEGQTYAGAMPPWGPTLSDAEIAAVTSYVRASWGNHATPIAVATVTQLRAAYKARTTPWTAAELARATTAKP